MNQLRTLVLTLGGELAQAVQAPMGSEERTRAAGLARA